MRLVPSLMDAYPLTQSGGSDDFPVPQPPYPVLTLASTLGEILALGCERSSDLTDADAVIEFLTPWDLRVAWPTLGAPKDGSLISVHVTARPMGGSRIGIWQSEPKPLPPPEPALAPALTSIAPNSTVANADVTVVLTGTGFSPGASVMVGPTAVTPSAESSTELTVTIPAADISIAGAVQIAVKNGDGQLSNEMALTLT